MLIIRHEQMEAFKQVQMRRFKDKMVDHLSNRFPEQMNEMPELDLRRIIQEGIEKAKGYDVTGEQDIRSYLEYMMTYGNDFDVNSETAWAGKILQKDTIDGSTKMEHIGNYVMFALKGKA